MEIIAAISGGSVLTVFVSLVIIGLVYYVADWGLTKCAPPEPLNKILRVLLVLAVVVFAINALLSLTSYGPFIRW